MKSGHIIRGTLLAAAMVACALTPAYAACPASGCAGAWLGVLESQGETVTVLVKIGAAMTPETTVVLVVESSEGAIPLEVEEIKACPAGSKVTIKVDAQPIGLYESMIITLRVPRDELIGSAKTESGTPASSNFTVSRIAPDMAHHVMGSAGVSMPAAAPAAAEAEEDGMPKGIKEALQTWKSGFEDFDLDKIMSTISEDFTHYEFQDKATFRAFVEGVHLQGELDDTEIDLQYAEATKNDDGTWTVYPIEVVAMFGSASVEATFKKEGDAWRVIGLEIEGI